MNDVFSIWKAEVRSYEVDIQKSVNNAQYLNYLDNARLIHLRSLNFDVDKLVERIST